MDKILSKTLYLEMSPGETSRILHEFDRAGEKCSIGKDPCMSIKRTATGLQYYCHRCEEKGFVKMDGLSPTEAAELAKSIQSRKDSVDEGLHAVVANLNIPADSTFITVKVGDAVRWNTNDVPWNAIHWLHSAGFLIPSDITFEVYWSRSYDRLIFPIRDTENSNPAFQAPLLGWVGRCVDGKAAKYMTRKQITKTDRLLYTCQGTEKVVFVEDILSALKVHKHTGFTTVALLTTALSFTLAKMFKGREMYLWLDGDMMSKSVRKVTRLASFGYKIHSIRTEKDPKEYHGFDIIETLKMEAN